MDDVSDEDMQNLWAAVLAGEVKKPKSYSLRTLETLRNISKDEAELFVKVYRYHIDNRYIWYPDYFFSVDEILLLEDAGLLSSERLTQEIDVEAKGKTCVGMDKVYAFVLNNNTDKHIKIDNPILKLSKAGREISTLFPSPRPTRHIRKLGEFSEKPRSELCFHTQNLERKGWWYH